MLLAPQVRDDVRARHLLQRAQGAFQKWPEGFRGFQASVHCRTQDHEAIGSVVVRPVGVEVSVSDPALRGLLETMLAEIAAERTPRFFKDGDGRFPITLDDETPHGDRRILVHRDDGRVAYRLDAAGRLRETEQTSMASRVVTRFEEFVRAMPGRVLPARTVSSFFDLRRGELTRTEAASDTHLRLDHVWLPSSRQITETSVGATRTILIELGRHALI